MTKLKWILPMLCLAVVLGGCPYKSELPIDNPSVKVDPALLGYWQSASKGYTVSKLDTYHYLISDKQSETGSEHKAFMSNVGTDRFLNVIDDSEGPTMYYLYRLTLNSAGNQITLSGVTENIDEHFSNSAELKAFIERNKHISFFYDKQDEVYTKR